jgi:hypothetical protein
MKYFIFAMIVFSCVGCDFNQIPGSKTHNEGNQIGDLVSYVDESRGVVCYRVYGLEGISCVKLEKCRGKNQ